LLPEVSMSTRDQWAAFGDNAFITSSIAADHNFANMKTGLGILMIYDSQARIYNSMNTALNYAYNIQISNQWNIRPGINFQIARQWINAGELFSALGVYKDSQGQYQPPEATEIKDASKNFIDMAASVLAISDHEWIGVTVDHLARPNIALRQNRAVIPIKYVAFAGKEFRSSYNKHTRREEKISVTTVFTYQGGNTQLNSGVYWVRTPIALGFYFRGIPFKEFGSDALIFLFGYKKENYSIGYSYDHTISRLSQVGGTGSHEISFTYTFNEVQQPAKRKMRIVPCPEW